MKSLYIISLVFVSTALLLGAPQDEVKLLRWAGPPGSRPGTFKEWIVSHPYTKFSVKLDKTVIGNRKAGTVAILIDSTIASSLTNEVHQLMTNLQREGYTVSSYQISGGTPTSLRSFLEDLYIIDNIEGALFIGDLPVAWFQVKDDYGDGYAEWPIDLFYMDLDGDWFDALKYDSVDILIPGQDGIYDAHSGDVAPEIYIGRLTPTGIGNDTLLIKNYLSKDNAYRHHTIELQHRALVYVDDDWAPWAYWHAWEVSILYPDTLVVSDPNTTIVSDYRVRLDTVREWVSVFVHSWPGGHAFYYNDSLKDYYWSEEYTSQDPPANFYNHFCCSFARYTTNGYGGGRAIFNQSYGVGAIGSTKAGSMLDFDYFYYPLSQGKTMGVAFKEWWDYIASDGITFDELCWHYGMTLLGDPFLKPTGHIDTVGTEEVSRQISAFFISQNHPNPFTSSTEIKYGFPKDTNINITIYNLSGQKVAVLVNEKKKAGCHTVKWNGENKYGKKVANGIYFYRLESCSHTATKKMYFVR